MKKEFLFLIMLLLVSTVEANNNESVSNPRKNYVINYHRPITFQENGIKFYVFANGEVEFQKNRRYTSYTSNRGRYGNRYYHSSPRRILVKYDRRGNLLRVGNVYLHYNYFGQVTKIGSVPVFYRHGNIKRVGGLTIKRDRYGYIRFQGKVKSQNNYYGSLNYYYNDHDYNYYDDFFYQDDFNNNYESFDEDEEYYYYKSKKTKSRKNSKGKMESKPIVIKRKKVKKK